jgi:hypothetical protein
MRGRTPAPKLDPWKVNEELEALEAAQEDA